MKTAFITDTGAGYTPNEMMEHGIYAIPLQIIIDDKTLLEGEDITLEEVYDIIATGKILKTSLGSMQRTQEVFTKLKEEGYTNVFAVPLANGLSGTLNMMRLCADEIGLTFDYVDCHVTANVQRYMIFKAKEMYEAGKTFVEIKQVLNEICDTTNTIIIPDDLQHLKRSGRLTPVAATLGGLLKIKPMLVINKGTEGKLDVFAKVRSMKKVMQVTLDNLVENIPDQGKGYIICVVDVRNPELNEELLNMFKTYLPYASFETETLVGTVGIHAGIGCIGVQYFKAL